MGLRDLVEKLVGGSPGSERLAGPPTSSNGASSHHLFWIMEAPVDDPVVEVEVDIEVIEPPTSDHLYFWALQASFAEHGLVTGAGHFGLQFHPGYPENGAVNWGGYYSRSSGRTGELHGSPLSMPSTLDNPNTCDYAWRPGTAYRYRIHPTLDGAWRGAITDLASGDSLVVRDLYCLGDSLTDVVMWTGSLPSPQVSDDFLRVGYRSSRVLQSLHQVKKGRQIVEPEFFGPGVARIESG